MIEVREVFGALGVLHKPRQLVCEDHVGEATLLRVLIVEAMEDRLTPKRLKLASLVRDLFDSFRRIIDRSVQALLSPSPPNLGIEFLVRVLDAAFRISLRCQPETNGYGAHGGPHSQPNLILHQARREAGQLGGGPPSRRTVRVEGSGGSNRPTLAATRAFPVAR